MSQQTVAMLATESARSSDSETSLNEYERFEVLHEGRLWTVYEGDDRRLNREVAIKVSNSATSVAAEIDEDYWEGMRALSRLSHEGLTAIYDLDPDRGWIVMQRATGDLATQQRGKPMKADDVARVIRQVAAGLGQLHAIGRMHGAVTASNLLVDEQGRVRLNAAPGIPFSGTSAPPSPEQRHVAPELLNTQQFGDPRPASDLYCLGFLALELLLGKRFDGLVSGLGKGGWIAWHASPAAALPPLESRLKDVPHYLVNVLSKLTSKSVEERYATAQEVLMDLARGSGQSVAELPTRAVSPSQQSLLDKVTDKTYWQEAIHSPAFVAKAAGSLVGICLLLTILSASTRSKQASVLFTSTLNGEVKFDSGETVAFNEQLELPAGEHTVTIRAEGYQNQRKTVHLIGGRLNEPSFDLKPDAKPAPPQQLIASLKVNSLPEAAVVTVTGPDGYSESKQGTLELKRLPPGRYRVEARCKGYEDRTDTIEITENTAHRVHEIKLRATSFPVTIVSTPPGAIVNLDGKPQTGRTPLTVPVTAGTHEIAVSHPGCKTGSREFEISDRGKYLAVELEKVKQPQPKRFEVVIRSDPIGADLYVDNARMGSTPARLQLTPGFHQLLMHVPGRKPVQTRIDIRSDGDIFFLRLPSETRQAASKKLGQDRLAAR